MTTTVFVIARRPYVRDAISYAAGDRIAVPAIEALQLATQGIVSLSRRTRTPTVPADRPRRRPARKSAA
jgi:hypothetical protein